MAETRMIRRSLIDSEKFNSLSWVEQAFFTRLMLIADDYGLFDARPTMLISNLFPTRIGSMGIRDVQGFLQRCEEIGVIKTYSVKGKEYGMIENYNQRAQSKPKLPIPEGWTHEKVDGKGVIHAISPRVTVTHREEPRGTEKNCLDVAEDEVVVEDGVVAEDAAVRLVEKSLQPRSEARATPSLPLPKSARDVQIMIAARHVPMSQQDAAACSEMFFEEMESVGWVDAKHRPIRNWQSAALVYAKRWANNIQSRALTKSKATGESNHKVSSDYDNL